MFAIPTPILSHKGNKELSINTGADGQIHRLSAEWRFLYDESYFAGCTKI